MGSNFRFWREAGFVFFVFSVFAASVANAQTCATSINLSPTYTQNFDTLATAGTTNTTLPTGWAIFRTTGTNQFAAGTGSSATGAIYSFGTGTATDRALGSLASSGTGTMFYGACFTNNTSNVIDAVNINYTGEQWRLGASPQTADLLAFQYSLTETTVNGVDFDGFSALNFASPITTGTIGALDGNAAANRTVIGVQKITGLNIAPGGTLFIRWVDVDTAGTDNGLGVDDFTISTVNAPTVTDIADQTIVSPGNSTLAVPFTTSDVETIPITNVIVSSDNQTVVPNGNLTLVSTGPNSWTIQALGAATGVATITVTVTDGDGNVTTTTFNVIVGGVPACASGGEIQVTPGTPAMDSASGITLYASAIASTPAAANLLDDTWVAAVGPPTASTADGNAGGLNGTNKAAIQSVTVGAHTFSISTREMGNLGSVNSAPCQGKNVSVGRTIFSNNTGLQDGAPRPTVIGAAAFSYSENLGGFNPSTGARNALLFDFNVLEDAFGAWFGDVEGRATVPADVRATVRFFDANGNRLGSDFVINETDPSFGNRVTRWIGFVSTTPVKSMLVIVGDNDPFTPIPPPETFYKRIFAPQLNGIGTNEHLSFVGAKFRLVQTVASVGISGRVTDPNGRGIPRVTVSMLDTQTGDTRLARTNPFGYYRFGGVPAGNFYILNATAKSYSFETQSFQLFEDQNEVNFVANSGSGLASGPGKIR